MDSVDRRDGLTVVLGLLTIALAGATLAWPAVTVRVLGVLFGLNLLVIGTVRAVLMAVAAAVYPRPYRIVAGVLGGLTAALGVLCLRNVQVSALLFVLVVGVGWLLAGITEGPPHPAGAADSLNAWRLGLGTAAVLAAAGVLIWPSLTLGDLVPIAAGLFLVAGSVELAAALLGLRRHGRRGTTDPPGIRP